MNSDDIHEFSNGELDRVIREALKVDADASRLARLEQYWVVQSRRQLWRRRALFMLPAAAAAVILVALLIVAKDGESNKQTAETDHILAPIQEDLAPVDEAFADDSESGAHSPSAGRAPTDYERFVFIARTGVQSNATSLTTKIDEAIEELILNPESDPTRSLESPGIDSSNAETLLLRRLARSDGAEQSAILRLLGVCGTSRSVPAIVRLTGRGADPEEALTTVEQIGGISGLTQVARTTANPKLRPAVITRLLAIDSEEALLAYLSLVRDEATRPIALATADATPGLPIAKLLALLDHDDKPVRLSAAMVLGHVNGPEVTQSLIARVTEKPSEATAAWLALMACRGPMAEEFLAYASRRPQLLGHLNNARVQWAHAIP